ncbi:MAG: recombination protein RecO [Sulfuricurvum sp. MLSB]|uniref:recombination protein RecO n=1 Tax=unclassified Sulfuricurvum TaxID=2632390 RepID=UPI0005030C74|nr:MULTISPECIES: recombination protein RecO [unclassified Sulfuricurvum]KFN38940.1 MAG: recombination protein RecO [Sulfuricurvum sp. MLSB]
MQGFIIKLTRAREEDTIVTIIAEESLQTLYRFYGARHSPINIGYKIDFETEHSLKSSIGRLRDVIHLGYPWLTRFDRIRLWQQFIALFHPHLKDAEDIGSFYFTLLEDAASRWNDQNPKRVAVESYVRLLEHEGRLHKEMHCFFCDAPIEGDISLIRAFLPAHKNCAHTLSINIKGLEWLYAHGSTLFLDDREIERLWYVINEGL